MSSESELFLFDATTYPGFERAIKLSKNSGMTLDERVEGYAVAAVFAAVILYFLYVGVPEDEARSYYIVLAVCFALLVLILYLILRMRTSTAIPVRISQNDMLVLGTKRWPLGSVREIVAWGRFGAVEFKNGNGKTIALIDRAQFGSYDDFLVVLGRIHPEIQARRGFSPVKVRLPDE